MSNHNTRMNMIKQQLRTGDVLNETILDLFEQIPRHEFVPALYAPFAYSDMHIPLSKHQMMLTPLEEGTILQALELTGTETVLEVGTGTGFLTAMLSKLCKNVISIDIFADFIIHAAEKLQAHGCDNVELIQGDGSRGWLDKAPYDIIVFTGALPELTKTHILQLLPGGKLFALEGTSPAIKGNLHQLDHNETWHSSLLFETDIPQLLDNLRPEAFVF